MKDNEIINVISGRYYDLFIFFGFKHVEFTPNKTIKETISKKTVSDTIYSTSESDDTEEIKTPSQANKIYNDNLIKIYDEPVERIKKPVGRPKKLIL